MNMYPKIVNINMNHNHCGNYDQFATNAHLAHLGYNQQGTNFGTQQTIGFLKQQNSHPTMPKSSTMKNITL